jgi:membrane peptidoglycan carboxypeptidase
MTMMMNKVVEEGSAKRAMLDDIRAAGKTGTTNSYRDACFVGHTGNFVCGLWYGNDDHSQLDPMTGGSLPAQTWHEIVGPAYDFGDGGRLNGRLGSRRSVIAGYLRHGRAAAVRERGEAGA